MFSEPNAHVYTVYRLRLLGSHCSSGFLDPATVIGLEWFRVSEALSSHVLEGDAEEYMSRVLRGYLEGNWSGMGQRRRRFRWPSAEAPRHIELWAFLIDLEEVTGRREDSHDRRLLVRASI